VSDVTELIVILDRSGSMQDRRADHEGGLRSFIRDQRALAGDVRLTFVRFDSTDPFEMVYDGARLADVDEAKLELIPRGGTPLLEAVGRTLGHVAERHSRVGKPAMVIAMVITDGQENASGHDWTKARVKSLVVEREAAGWKVLYLGANVDEFSEGAALGIGASASLGYAAAAGGVQAMYCAVTDNVRSARLAAASGASLDSAYQTLNWTAEQRSTTTKGQP
jgi:Mg-chelatase subunit ChlD